MLHPCQTSELLDLMLNPDEAQTSAAESSIADSGLQYMTAWFSLVGPLLSLQLDTRSV